MGEYTAKDLIERGISVDVIGLSDNPFEECKGINYYKFDASLKNLTDFLEGKYYDGIVDYLWYHDVSDYPPFHTLIARHTQHHIFLSSYRVYADLEHPIKESSPKLADVVTDRDFLAREDYAVAKIKCERYLESSPFKNWTVVRPVISTSMRRFDLICQSGDMLLRSAAKNEPVRIPASCRFLTAAVDWAGNTGMLISRLLCNENTLCKSYTVTSGENLLWDTVAQYYADILGLRYEWISDIQYVRENIYPRFGNDWIFRYDRKFDRKIDNSAVLQATGLTKNDFVPLRDGIMIELDKAGVAHNG